MKKELSKIADRITCLTYDNGRLRDFINIIMSADNGDFRCNGTRFPTTDRGGVFNQSMLVDFLTDTTERQLKANEEELKTLIN